MAASARIDELRHRYAAQPRRFLAPLANALRESGALEEAVTMLRAQLAEFPDHLTGHVVLGRALFDTGALADAQTAFEAARALDPGNRVVLRQLGEIASLAGDRETARRWFERLRAAEPYADDVGAQLGGGPTEPPDAEMPDAELPGRATAAVVAAQEVAADPAADAFVPEPIASEPFELLDFEARAVDPVVGLDVAPDAPPAELEPVLDAAHDGSAPNGPVVDDAPPIDESSLGQITTGPFATETMAGLLAAQGHTAQAIALYERLSAERPGDLALRGRLEALRRGPTVAQASDQVRATLLTAAFGDLAPSRAGAPPPHVAPDTSSVAVAATPPDADADPYADLSFDRFFAASESPAVPAPEPDGAIQPSAARDDDLARFDAWLREVA